MPVEPEKQILEMQDMFFYAAVYSREYLAEEEKDIKDHGVANYFGQCLYGNARGKLPPAIVSQMLETGERPAPFPTAPAHGLVLMRVEYRGK